MRRDDDVRWVLSPLRDSSGLAPDSLLHRSRLRHRLFEGVKAGPNRLGRSLAERFLRSASAFWLWGEVLMCPGGPAGRSVCRPPGRRACRRAGRGAPRTGRTRRPQCPRWSGGTSGPATRAGAGPDPQAAERGRRGRGRGRNRWVNRLMWSCADCGAMGQCSSTMAIWSAPLSRRNWPRSPPEGGPSTRPSPCSAPMAFAGPTSTTRRRRVYRSGRCG